MVECSDGVSFHRIGASGMLLVRNLSWLIVAATIIGTLDVAGNRFFIVGGQIASYRVPESLSSTIEKVFQQQEFHFFPDA